MTEDPRPRDDIIPPLTRSQARALVAGVCLNVLGGVVAFWSFGSDGRGFLVGWVMVAAGIAVAFLAGGRRFVPRTPREVLATARAGGLPAWPVTVLVFTLFAASLVGLLYHVVLNPPRK
jgi:uncharacterized membrane protein